MDTPKQLIQAIQVTREEIQAVLKNWRNSRQLGEHPLTGLTLVEQQRRSAGYDDSPAGRGRALKDVVGKAVATLKPAGWADDEELADKPPPEDDRGRYFVIITEQFFNEMGPGYVQAQLNIERGWYYQKRREALDLLTDILLEWEQEANAALSSLPPQAAAPPTVILPTRITSPPDVASPPDIGGLIGRTKELHYYQEKLDELNYVLIVGFPGVGKTALAARLVRETVAADKIFWYKCHEGDGADSLIWALAGFLANRGQDELWQILNVAIANEREAMPLSMRITYAMKLLAQDHYLICLDDFQHVDADKDIVQLASRFYEMMQKNQLKLVITSHRTPAFIQHRFEPLTGLTSEDTGQLVAARGLALAPRQLAKLYANTEGHALFLSLGIDALKESSTPDQLLSALPEDEQIERFLLRAVDQQISDEERKVMGALAILGDYGGGRDLIETILNEGAIRRPLQTLSERNLLTVSLGEGGRVYSQHAIVRAYYYDNLGLSQRRTMHKRAAEHYMAVDFNALVAIIHNTKAGAHVQAVELVVRHTWALINQGHAGALHSLFAQIAVELLPAELRARFHLARGQIAALLGEGRAARQFYQSAMVELRSLAPSAKLQELRGGSVGGWVSSFNMKSLSKQSSGFTAVSTNWPVRVGSKKLLC